MDSRAVCVCAQTGVWTIAPPNLAVGSYVFTVTVTSTLPGGASYSSTATMAVNVLGWSLPNVRILVPPPAPPALVSSGLTGEVTRLACVFV